MQLPSSAKNQLPLIMPFSSSLPHYLNDSSRYASPTLGSKAFVPPLENDEPPEEPNVLDIEERNPNLDESIHQLDSGYQLENKFFFLPRNLYQEDACPSPDLSVTTTSQYQAYTPNKLYTNYQGRLPNFLESPFSQFEEDKFETSSVFDTAALGTKEEHISGEDQEQKMFLPDEDARDVFSSKTIYPWMVDSRHNTKHRQQPPVVETEKDHFNQLMGTHFPYHLTKKENRVSKNYNRRKFMHLK